MHERSELLTALIAERLAEDVKSICPTGEKTWNRILRVNLRSGRTLIAKVFNPNSGTTSDIVAAVMNATQLSLVATAEDSISLAVPFSHGDTLPYIKCRGVVIALYRDFGDGPVLRNAHVALAVLSEFAGRVHHPGLLPRICPFAQPPWEYISRRSELYHDNGMGRHHVTIPNSIEAAVLKMSAERRQLVHGDFKIANLGTTSSGHIVYDCDNLRYSVQEDDGAMLLLSIASDRNMHRALNAELWNYWVREFVEQGFDKHRLFLCSIVHVVRLIDRGAKRWVSVRRAVLEALIMKTA
jgi:hypothetical protein